MAITQEKRSTTPIFPRDAYATIYAIYLPLLTSNGSKNSKINRQTDRRKQTVSLNEGQTNYITVYIIPQKCKIKMEQNNQKRRNLDNKGIDRYSTIIMHCRNRQNNINRD